MANTDGAPMEVLKDWRKFFGETMLERAEGYLKKGYLREFSCGEREARGRLITNKNGVGEGYTVQIQNAPDSFSAEWDPDGFSCTCVAKTARTLYENRTLLRYSVCVHEAAVLLHWEAERGQWKFRETREELEARLERERKAREELLEKHRIEQEKRRRAEQKSREQKEVLPAQYFFPEPEDNTFFDVRAVVKRLKTNRYCVNRGQSVLTDGNVEMEPPALTYNSTGEQVLNVKGRVYDGVETCRASLEMTQKEMGGYRCSCYGMWYNPYQNQPLCEHLLALLTKVREYLQKENPGDVTDRAAASFFEALDAVPSGTEEAAREVKKERTFILAPRIILDSGGAMLSFKAGVQGSKLLMLRSYREFLDAVEAGKPFALSKAVTVDFGTVDFTEDSLPWLRFLQRRVSETETVNEQIERKASRSYYYGYQKAPTLSVRTRDTLTGATLDRFYEMAEGTEVEYQDKDRKTTGNLRIGHTAMRVRLQSKPIQGRGGTFQGMQITGEMPVMLRGSAGSYIFNDRGLSRITREEEQFLRPFREASDEAGHIRFRVGKDHFAEFYYRVVPRFLESPYVDFEDLCAQEAEPLLPPEPAFTFRLDIDGMDILCDARVAYGEEKQRPLFGKREGEYRDTAQEARVDTALRKYFRQPNPGTSRYRQEASEDNLYRLLTEGLPDLERYGEVLGSEAFRRSTVRSAPRFRVSVSIESGLLDLSILSQDVEPAELLDLLESYRQKKRFHRLRSGDFVTLDQNGQLASLDELAEGLSITAEDVILHGAEMPVYRALYLDKLLEAHDALVSSRDRTYRALVRNFASIRDADYEVPEAQAETLRPYQVYGYKWLRTLTAAGFGGILADEMGLGKTLQTIALMQALRDEGDQGPMLVVCPASLVFNWQEEFTRFAPGLTVYPVAGTAGARKDLLRDLEERGGEADAVCVTSYDLLRKDAALYEKFSFSVMVLDEAQYIKNQKAAMTKAVKGIRAEHRFALTGTPIENRLAELWSIFDFLMPGFLYGYTEFARKFETPVTKNKDEAATARLKQMTGPFILRRLKTDVLKDLPPKMEEVRYTRFEDEQRKVYDGQVVRMKELLARSGETGQDKVKIFAELMRIRQICCDPSLLFEDYRGGSAKRDACLELIQNAMGGGHRMLLFSQFTSMLELIEEDLNREGIGYYKITGATPKEQRIRLVRDFNEGDTPVFLISLKAGGTGLNLTGADVVIHYDPWWNVAAQNQATDRAHRIGQTRQVTVYRMIVKDTIEEKILALQEAKRDLADAVLSGESASLSSLSNEELMELLS